MIKKYIKENLIENTKGNTRGKFMREMFLETYLGHQEVLVNFGIISRRKKRRKKNYAMVKLNVPKRVTLPNGRTFISQYKRIKRSKLPPNIVMRRTYTQRAAPRGRRHRRRQQGQGIFDFVKKVARNPLVKSSNKKGLEYAPGVYHNLTKRVKNKTLKRILNSDAAHLALNKAIKTANNRLSNG